MCQIFIRQIKLCDTPPLLTRVWCVTHLQGWLAGELDGRVCGLLWSFYEFGCSGVARASPDGRVAFPEGQNEEENENSYRKNKKNLSKFEERMRKVEFLHTWDCEAALATALFGCAFVPSNCFDLQLSVEGKVFHVVQIDWNTYFYHVTITTFLMHPVENWNNYIILQYKINHTSITYSTSFFNDSNNIHHKLCLKSK